MIFISLVASIIMIGLSKYIKLNTTVLDFLGKYSLELYLLHLTLIPIIRNICSKTIFKGEIGCLSIFIMSIFLVQILRKCSNSIENYLKIGEK